MERTSERIALVENDEAMVISGNHKIVVWYQDQALQIMNLGTEQVTRIDVERTRRAVPWALWERISFMAWQSGRTW